MPTTLFLYKWVALAGGMKYERDIIGILCEAGSDGLSVQKIVLHLYNANNTLFAPVQIGDIRRTVQAWLLRNSRSADSLVCRCAKRGHYRLNMRSAAVRQLMLNFSADAECPATETNATREDTPAMPSLFDDMGQMDIF